MKGIWYKNMLGPVAGFLSRSRLCGCCKHALGHTVGGVSERGPAIKGLIKYRIRSIKEVWVLVLGFFMFLSAVFPEVSLVLDFRDRVGGLRGKVESDCEEFEDNESGGISH